MNRTLGTLGLAAFVSALAMATALPALAAGTLRVGLAVGAPPFEYDQGRSKNMVGFDIDLMRAIGRKLQRPVTFIDRPFKKLLTSLSAGAFDVVASSVIDSTAREKTVDFVDYLLVGTGMLVKEGNPLRLFTLSSLCGMTVPFEINTVQQTDVTEASGECMRVHLGKIDALVENSVEQGIADLANGRATAYINDYSIVAYLARTIGGGHAYQVAGRQFAVRPYGIALPKNRRSLRDDIQRALVAVIADGTYDALLKKWGLEQTAMRSARINVGALYE